MSGPPQGHQCGKFLLHTRGFCLKILHPKTPTKQMWRSTNFNINKQPNLTSVNTNFDKTPTKVKPNKANYFNIEKLILCLMETLQ